MAGNSTKRVQKYRAKMKAAGLKRVTIWVPDINAPGYREKIRRECELINASADSNRVMDEMLAGRFQAEETRRLNPAFNFTHLVPLPLPRRLRFDADKAFAPGYDWKKNEYEYRALGFA